MAAAAAAAGAAAPAEDAASTLVPGLRTRPDAYLEPALQDGMSRRAVAIEMAAYPERLVRWPLSRQ